MTIIYRDFSFNFRPNPITGDISMLTNEQSINQSLKNLILMNFGDVEYDQKIGSNLRARLFNLNTPNVRDSVEGDIRLVIESYEPRVDIIDIKVEEIQSGNGINVTIIYRAKTSTEEVEVTFFLERVI